MKLLIAALSLVTCASAACSVSPSSDDGQGGASFASTELSTNATGNASPTLIGDWLFKLQTGEDEIKMTSTTTGHAQLYWYDSGEAQWQVSAVDSGSGSATLTLSCVSSDCANASDIVLDCTYTLIALKCTGVSGGIMNNYKNYPFTFTKQ